MPRLMTAKQEALARGLTDGLHVREAAALADMDLAWARKLAKRADVRARVAELKRPRLEDVTRQLGEIAASAVAFKSAAGLAAARAALMDMARLNGLGSGDAGETTNSAAVRMAWADKPPMTEAEWFAKYAPKQE